MLFIPFGGIILSLGYIYGCAHLAARLKWGGNLYLSHTPSWAVQCLSLGFLRQAAPRQYTLQVDAMFQL